MKNASRGRFPPAPEYLLAAAVRARRYLSRSQPLLLDPQVMPRRLRIAPRLIMLAARTRGDPAAPCDVTNRLAAAGRDGAAR
jgi:hypothetical protein